MTLKYIADEFCMLVHLEFNILILHPQPDLPASPKATLDSVPEVWRYMWQEIQSSRVQKEHLITKPRLRSLDLIVGSERDQNRFKFDLSDRDNEARLGIANVKSTEVEALLSKVSSKESSWDDQQALTMKHAKEKAEKGPHVPIPYIILRDTRAMLRPPPFWDKIDEERFYYQ